MPRQFIYTESAALNWASPGISSSAYSVYFRFRPYSTVDMDWCSHGRKELTNGRGWAFKTYSNYIRWYHYNSAGGHVGLSPGTLPQWSSNKWAEILLVYDGTTGRIFFDGDEFGSSSSFAYIAPSGASDPIKLCGKPTGDTTSTYTGYGNFFDFGYFDRAISLVDLEAIRGGMALSVPGVRFYCPFLGGSSLDIVSNLQATEVGTNYDFPQMITGRNSFSRFSRIEHPSGGSPLVSRGRIIGGPSLIGRI
jgi:hypothetical protein